MPELIQIFTSDEDHRLVGATAVKTSVPRGTERRQKPEPVLSVHPGVPPYGTPEFWEFVRKLNESLNG